MSPRRVRLLVATLAWLSACAPGAGRVSLPEDTAAEAPEGLIVVSVAGLTPARYRGAAPDMPAVARLARAGVSADAVRPVAPASGYPAHATLVSGRTPAGHGIVADRRIGRSGVSGERYGARQLRAPTLWQVAREARLRVAVLGWPSTQGASLPWSLSDAEPTRTGESWLDAAGRSGGGDLVAWAREAGGDAPEARLPGSARDEVLVEVACRLIQERQPPQLLLLYLGQTLPPLAALGADAPGTRSAFAAADAGIAKLLHCAGRAGRLSRWAIAVVGDHGTVPVHSVVAPNVALADAGLLTPSPRSGGLVSWEALARSNGGSAFVYARNEEAARLARLALERAAARSGAFRVVSADEMLRLGADPEAWFGIEANPGYVVGDAALGELVGSTSVRAAWGYLPGRREMDAGFVAWGAGLASGRRVTQMSQTDVGPTLAKLLGLRLPDAEGRELVGLLRLPSVSANPAAGQATP